MPIDDFEPWRDELIRTGRIVQDDDPPELLEHAKELSNRYVELAGMAKGVYEQRVFQALVDSLQVEHDYEIYETTIGLLFSFPPHEFGKWLAEALPGLIARQSERAGDVLSLMVNGHKAGDPRLVEFKAALRNLPEDSKTKLRAFVIKQEESGWLRQKRGWYDDVRR